MATDTIDAAGRLLTPTFVDAHFHSGLLFGDSVTTGGRRHVTHLSGRPDSIAAYRRRFASSYLPYGVALVRDVGSAERDLPMLMRWRDSADAPDLLVSGAALVSPEPGRQPPAYQVEVRDSADAARKVREYYAAGIRNVKLYWQLRDKAFQGAIVEARRLGMTVTAHVDYGVVTHVRALELGLRHFEHVHPIAASILRRDEVDAAGRQAAALIGGPPQSATTRPGAFFQFVTEQWNVVGPRNPRVRELIDKLHATRSTLTPTLHVIAQPLGLAYFTTPASGPFEDVSSFTRTQRERAKAGYRIMSEYVREMDQAGVHLAIGTDTPDGGRAVLSEMLLLRATGISMWRVFRIATLYSAEAVGEGDDYGAVEAGRRADLILFDGNPLADPQALLRKKIVIKDGVPYFATSVTVN